MKRYIKIIILFVLFLPIFVFADKNFDDGKKMANDYIYSLPEYSRYLLSSGNLPFGYDTTGVVTADGFSTGGFLNEIEFTKSRNNGVSWLAPGIQYWLANGKALDLKINPATKSGIRVTEYVRHETKVKGIGTITTPWEFVDGYTVKILSTDKSKGTIQEPAYEHVEIGDTRTFTFKLNGNFKPITTECENNNNGHFEMTTSGDTRTITVSKIIGDFTCSINFNIGCNKVTFKNVKNTTNGMHNKSFYYKLGYGWYTDNTCRTVVKNSDISLPTFRGYIFNSYKYSNKEIINNSKKLYSNLNDSYISNNIEAKADWTPITYTVKYDCNNGTGSTAQSTHTYDVAKNLTANGCSRTGYDFLGWNTNKNATSALYTDKKSVTNLADTQGAVVTLYAIWKAKSVKVVFYKNATSSDTTTVTQTFTYGNTVNRFGYNASGSPNWTQSGQFGQWDKKGYTLLGWNTNRSATTQTYVPYWNVSNDFIINNNTKTITLYGIWKANTYTVKYNCNGGSGSTAQSTHTYDVSRNLTANGCSRAGYKFLGWSDNSGDKTAKYSNGQSVINLSAAQGSTYNLYAIWQSTGSCGAVITAGNSCSGAEVRYLGYIESNCLDNCIGGPSVNVYNSSGGKRATVYYNGASSSYGYSYGDFGVSLDIEPDRWSLHSRTANVYTSTVRNPSASQLSLLSATRWEIWTYKKLYIFKRDCIKNPVNYTAVGRVNTLTLGGIGGPKAIVYDISQNVTDRVVFNDMQNGQMKGYPGFGFTLDIEPYRWSTYARVANMFYSTTDTDNASNLTPLSMLEWGVSSNKGLYIYRKDCVETPNYMTFLGTTNSASTGGVGGPKIIAYDKKKNLSENITFNGMSNGQTKNYTGFGINLEIEPHRWSAFATESNLYYSTHETNKKSDLSQFSHYSWSLGSNSLIYIYKKTEIETPPNMVFLGTVNTSADSGVGGPKLVAYDNSQKKSEQITFNGMQNGQMKNYTGFGVTYENDLGKWSVYAREAGVYYSTKETENMADLKLLSSYDWGVSASTYIYIYKKIVVSEPNNMSLVGTVNSAALAGVGGPKIIAYDKLSNTTEAITFNGMQNGQMKNYNGFGVTLDIEPDRWALYSRSPYYYYSTKETSSLSDLKPLSMIEWGVSDRKGIYIYKKNSVVEPPNMHLIGDVHTASTGGVGGPKLIVYDKVSNKTEAVMLNGMQNGQMNGYSGFGVTQDIEPDRWSTYAREAGIYFSTKETSSLSDLTPLSFKEWGVGNNSVIYLYKSDTIKVPAGMTYVGETHVATTGGAGGPKAIAYDHVNKKSYNLIYNSLMPNSGQALTDFTVSLNAGNNWKLSTTKNNIYYSTKETDNAAELTKLSSVNFGFDNTTKYYIYRK